MKYTDKLRAIGRIGMLAIAAAALFVACEKDNGSDKPGPEPEISFMCDVSDLTASHAIVTISPTDGYTDYYYFDVMEKEVYESRYANNQDLLVEEFEQMVQEYADYYISQGMISSVEELMEQAIASQGIANYEYQTLNPLTDYYVWACGVDLQGKVTTSIVIAGEFTTLDVEHSGLTFDIVYDPDTYNLTLTPSNEDNYVWSILSASDFQEYYDNSAEEYAKDLVEYYIESGLLEMNLYTGPTTMSMILTASVGENVVIAAGYKDGINSEVAVYRFDFEGNPSATIPGDVNSTFGPMTSAFYSNWGEIPEGSGLDQATVMLSDYDSMEQLFLDVWYPHGEAISGTYEINNTNQARTAIAGRITSTLNPSFYATMNEETLEFEQYALLESGTITISGDDMTMFYTLTVDAKSGDYSVKIDYTGMMFSASSAAAPLPLAVPAAKIGAVKMSQPRNTEVFGKHADKENPHVEVLSALAK